MQVRQRPASDKLPAGRVSPSARLCRRLHHDAAERALALGSGSVADHLSSWREGCAKEAILAFVRRTCGEDGSEPVSAGWTVINIKNARTQS
jgi:hypothetical protein